LWKFGALTLIDVCEVCEIWKGRFRLGNVYSHQNYLYYNILILCVSVWPAIDSAPGGHIGSRPVSLEPVWPEGVQREKVFSEKWPVAKLPKKKVKPLWQIWQFFLYIFAVHSLLV
jgi:hypothetical protein